MKEFPSTERRTIVDTAENLSRMLKSRTVQNKRKQVIHLPKPTSTISVDLLSKLSTEKEQRNALMTAEIEQLQSNAAIFDSDELQQSRFTGQVTRTNGDVSISDADIQAELKKKPCFVSMGTASTANSLGIPQITQYLRDIGYIDDDTTTTEIIQYRRVTTIQPVKMLACHGGKRFKQFKGCSSWVVKLIIDCNFEDRFCRRFIDSVLSSLGGILGNDCTENLNGGRVHGESGGTAVLVQMTAQAHEKLYELCRDRPGLLAGLDILEVCTLDGAVAFNLRPIAVDSQGKNIDPDHLERLVEEFVEQFPDLDRDELQETMSTQPDREHANMAATKLAVENDPKCLNKLRDVFDRVEESSIDRPLQQESSIDRPLQQESRIDRPLQQESSIDRPLQPSRHVTVIEKASEELSAQLQPKYGWKRIGQPPPPWFPPYDGIRITVHQQYVYMFSNLEKGLFRASLKNSNDTSSVLQWQEVCIPGFPDTLLIEALHFQGEKMYLVRCDECDLVYVIDECSTIERKIPCNAEGTRTASSPNPLVLSVIDTILVYSWFSFDLIPLICTLDTRQSSAQWVECPSPSLHYTPRVDSCGAFCVPISGSDTTRCILKLDVSACMEGRSASWSETRLHGMQDEIVHGVATPGEMFAAVRTAPIHAQNSRHHTQHFCHIDFTRGVWKTLPSILGRCVSLGYEKNTLVALERYGGVYVLDLPE
ncbi:uncharacterized protein LOC135819634 isoform X2 [Sycon ciliatum]